MFFIAVNWVQATASTDTQFGSAELIAHLKATRRDDLGGTRLRCGAEILPAAAGALDLEHAAFVRM